MSTIESKHLTLKINSYFHDLMKELSSRKRIFVSALYDEALELYLNQPENYLGEDFKIPSIKELRSKSRCAYHNHGQRCYLFHGHDGKHKVQGVND